MGQYLKGNNMAQIQIHNSACFYFYFYFLLFYILHTSTMHKTTSLADEGNSAYCQSSGAHNIKHI